MQTKFLPVVNFGSWPRDLAWRWYKRMELTRARSMQFYVAPIPPLGTGRQTVYSCWSLRSFLLLPWIARGMGTLMKDLDCRSYLKGRSVSCTSWPRQQVAFHTLSILRGQFCCPSIWWLRHLQQRGNTACAESVRVIHFVDSTFFFLPCPLTQPNHNNT